MTHVRKRRLCLLFIIVNLTAGPATRWYPQYMPALVTTYGDDLLSATCIFFGMRFMLIKQQPAVNSQ